MLGGDGGFVSQAHLFKNLIPAKTPGHQSSRTIMSAV